MTWLPPIGSACEMRMRILVSVLFALVVAVPAVAATSAKPKPWQWTPQKVVLKLTAAKPISAGGLGRNILSTRCTPKGRGVAGRYSRFTCDTRYGGSNGSNTTVLSVRVLPVGSGKFCIVTVTFPNLPGKFFSVDASSGKPGPPLTKPEFACP